MNYEVLLPYGLLITSSTWTSTMFLALTFGSVWIWGCAMLLLGVTLFLARQIGNRLALPREHEQQPTEGENDD